MKIGLDIRPFLSGETGVGVYFRNLLHAMADRAEEDRFYLFSSSLRERFPADSIPPFRNRTVKDLRIPVSLLNFLWFRFRFPPMGMFFGTRLHLTHSPNPLITPGGKKKVITIHDLSFIDYPDLAMTEAVTYFATRIRKSIDRADRIISVSEFTKSRLGEIFGKGAEDKASVIYHASDLGEVTERKPDFPLPDKYFLFTGTIEPRKNLPTLVKGFSLAKERLGGAGMVLAGSRGARAEEVKRLISMLKLEEDILWTGYIGRRELKYLYRNATALVFPSHYEGFGLPILEAASCGIPSVVSDIEVFREIFGEYPLYFKKDDPEALAEMLVRIHSEQKMRESKKGEAETLNRRFSWAKAAADTLELYHNI